ncbi:MAG: sulfate adenylyltransferase [Syntrophobacteria bacterium]|nr:sulfate adenylyltransferase [Deltaproteobacteria bacterium]PNV87439.1 MAG: sulfate adenylyltransferase [Desulfobacteraceae bacterium]MDH3772718.1 sulfate adenylyltransferase [Deltaproteobacteria bacterium]MDH3850905.1 sulfate adenylyltransferase [Deltaproteobacteria bacterium]MDH3895935.1 sulfate adenylyltransferase [Deltaproteobacteria bacterium]
MSKLVPPHGKERKLKPLLLEGAELKAEVEKAKTLKQVPMTSREASDVLMLGIGAFTPLEGFMGYDDWKGVCDKFLTTDGTFWPIPITLSVTKELADSIDANEEVALVDVEHDDILATMKVTEKYTIDKVHECKAVFGTDDAEGHPGVQKVMAQEEINLAGPIKVLGESFYPSEFGDLYQTPAQSRAMFEERGWDTVAALQLRNPMHNSHAYLAWIAIEVCDGVYIHQLVGKLKEGDIPADVRVDAIQALVDNYFRKERVLQGGYPMEMRYAGPREALLHACFRQNYGCSHLIVGRDHAGVGDYYGPFDAQKIFLEIPEGSLELKPLPLDWTFYCYECGTMASMKTCPHDEKAVIDEDGNYVSGARLLLSGTMLRKMLSEDKPVPPEFSKPEVIKILKAYYAGLEEKVEIKLHGAATGDVEKK